MVRNRNCKTVWKAGLLLTFLLPLTVGAQSQSQYGGQAFSPAASPASSLRVTGTTKRFTVIADRSDVRDTIKTIFDQAERQFTLDNNVVGQVTLRLQDQPLSTALSAICRQAFLKYSTHPTTNITFFERDDAAVREAFLRLRLLDARLRDQMRLMGLSLPPETTAFLLQNPIVSNGFNAANAPGLAGPAGPAGPPGSSDTKAEPKRNRSSLAFPRAPSIYQEGVAPGAGRMKSSPAEEGYDASLSRNGDGAGSESQLQEVMRQNRFVTFRVPTDKPAPVIDVLKDLGAQASVPILIDPGVPNGKKFTIRGSMSPRPLSDALNLLAPYARLEWKWVGDSIFVTTSPDFEVMFGETGGGTNAYGPRTPLNATKKVVPTPPKSKP